MHQVEDLFEQHEVLRRLPQSGTDHDTGEVLGPQSLYDIDFSFLTWSDQE